MPWLYNVSKRRHCYFQEKLANVTSSVKHQHRILLIGPNDSGKSTLVKQMKLIASRSQTFDVSYRNNFKFEICFNLMEGILLIIERLEKSKKLPKDPKFLENISVLRSVKKEIIDNSQKVFFYFESKKKKHFLTLIEEIWTNKKFNYEIQQNDKLLLFIENLVYFLKKIEYLKYDSYTPSDEDILLLKNRTAGYQFDTIVYDNIVFELIDAPGRRDQRAKWSEALADGFSSVIYLTDISAYDRKVDGLDNVNYIDDAVELLSKLWRKQQLKRKSIILLLNKQDLLVKKVCKNQSIFENYFSNFRDQTVLLIFNIMKDCRRAWKRSNKKLSNEWIEKMFEALPRGYIKRYSEEFVNDICEIKASFNETFLDKRMHKFFKDDEDYVKSDFLIKLKKNTVFQSIQEKLLKVNFFRIILITVFLKNYFSDCCEQTITRRLYIHTTVAVDTKCIKEVIELNKDVLQGKIISEAIMY